MKSEINYQGSTADADLHRRTANRYQIAAPVSYWWSGQDESVHTGQGITQNISSSGVLIVAHICPPKRVRLHLEVRLPRSQESAHGMELHGDGSVIRIESIETADPCKRTTGFAVSVQFYPAREGTAGESSNCGAEWQAHLI
jgi:hypothetical protein